MRFLGLNLPPLTLILLLALLWLILLVLLVWSWLRPRRPLTTQPPASNPKPAPNRENERPREKFERDTPVRLPRPNVVREVKPEPSAPAKADTERPSEDPFDTYRPNSRRDDFDF